MVERVQNTRLSLPLFRLSLKSEGKNFLPLFPKDLSLCPLSLETSCMWGLWLSAQRLQFVCQCVRAYVCLAVHCQSPMTAYFSQLVRRQVIGMFALLCDLVSVCVCECLYVVCSYHLSSRWLLCPHTPFSVRLRITKDRNSGCCLIQFSPSPLPPPPPPSSLTVPQNRHLRNSVCTVPLYVATLHGLRSLQPLNQKQGRQAGKSPPTIPSVSSYNIWIVSFCIPEYLLVRESYCQMLPSQQ